MSEWVRWVALFASIIAVALTYTEVDARKRARQRREQAEKARQENRRGW